MERRALVAAALVLLAGCASEPSVEIAPVPSSTTVTTSTVLPTTTAGVTTTVRAATPPTVRRTTTTLPTPADVAYRVERRTSDDATADFVATVDATLADARGWSQAGFRFVRGDDAPYLIVLAEGSEVDALCLPYDTYGKYSCQNGPVVAINADRWRASTSKWTGDLATYRQMLVNHEVGHLLGQKHPKPQCPRTGEPAPVMNQQSTELDGCLPNPWPLPWEVALAARHDRALAPPYGA